MNSERLNYAVLNWLIALAGLTCVTLGMVFGLVGATRWAQSANGDYRPVPTCKSDAQVACYARITP